MEGCAEAAGTRRAPWIALVLADVAANTCFPRRQVPRDSPEWPVGFERMIPDLNTVR